MRVLVLDHIHQAGVDLLRQHADVTHLAQVPRSEELAEVIGDFHGLVMRVTPRISRQTLMRPGDLRVISVASVGLDHIDLAAATERGIQVFNQPGVNRDSVAEFTFGLLLCLVRMLPQASADLRQGRWSRERFQHGVELAGRTLGVIGFGVTGSRVAEIAAGFRMRVLSYSPYTPNWRAAKHGVRLVSLEELLCESDVVSIHCPLNPSTRGMIGSRELSLMRPGSYLLNLARGGIVDEEALYHALETHHLAGAAMDVFAVEPPVANPLLTLPNFMGTPHVAGPTADSLWRAGTQAAQLVLEQLGIAGEESRVAARA